MNAEEEFEKWFSGLNSGWWPDSKKCFAAGFAIGRKAGMEEAEQIAENIDPVEVSGYYAQLGDAFSTKSNIVAAIRQRIEEGE